MRVPVRSGVDGMIVASGSGPKGRDQDGLMTDQRPSAVACGLILFSCGEPRDTRRNNSPPAPESTRLTATFRNYNGFFGPRACFSQATAARICPKGSTRSGRFGAVWGCFFASTVLRKTVRSADAAVRCRPFCRVHWEEVIPNRPMPGDGETDLVTIRAVDAPRHHLHPWRPVHPRRRSVQTPAQPFRAPLRRLLQSGRYQVPMVRRS